MKNSINQTKLLIYKTEDGKINIEPMMVNESIWLTINEMAELFGIDKSGISRHLKNIYNTGELDESSTVANFATVQKEGERKISRQLQHYNLDAIISVGYRVNSIRGTDFRIWATKKLKEYLIKGFIMDDNRLKESENERYFEELLSRIRDIRSSEKIFWRKILDIYSTSIDYDPKSEKSINFFKQIQNKMHWAAHGHTAAELIYNRVDSEKTNMGITNFPGNKIIKRDTEIAKNYLNEEELNILNRIVTAYLELAELQALNKNIMTMKDWIERLNEFLKMTQREILSHSGKISHEDAITKAHQEYEKFRKISINEPTEIEKHFIESETQIKKIKNEKKR